MLGGGWSLTRLVFRVQQNMRSESAVLTGDGCSLLGSLEGEESRHVERWPGCHEEGRYTDVLVC